MVRHHDAHRVEPGVGRVAHPGGVADPSTGDGGRLDGPRDRLPARCLGEAGEDVVDVATEGGGTLARPDPACCRSDRAAPCVARRVARDGVRAGVPLVEGDGRGARGEGACGAGRGVGRGSAVLDLQVGVDDDLDARLREPQAQLGVLAVAQRRVEAADRLVGRARHGVARRPVLPALVGGAGVGLREQALVGRSAVRRGVRRVGEDVARHRDDAQRGRPGRAGAVAREVGGEEAGPRGEVVVAAHDDLAAGRLVAGGQRRTDAGPAGALDDAQRDAVGVRLEERAAAVDVTVEDDHDLPGLVERLGGEGVEQHREPAYAAPGGDDDGQGRLGHATILGSRGRLLGRTGLVGQDGQHVLDELRHRVLARDGAAGEVAVGAEEDR